MGLPAVHVRGVLCLRSALDSDVQFSGQLTRRSRSSRSGLRVVDGLLVPLVPLLTCSVAS
ncbi:hypothetical protein E2C01_090680 [Portunus trituberculatus]|uniref:Uncharacterized protein n=1 Tax=Portunus trituberculatus TaxID=210409 RepID=A0A5B7JME4_PORTR|nr:hypothetical protein [Portunus trituberculatus]